MPAFRKVELKRTPFSPSKFLKVTAAMYASAGFVLYYMQRKFLFHPVKLPHWYQFNFNIPFCEVNIPFNENDNCNLVQFFPQDQVSKGVVLYFHGNRDNINR